VDRERTAIGAQGSDRLEHGEQLHALVRGANGTTRAVRLAIGSNGPRPTAWAGVSCAGTVGEDVEPPIVVRLVRHAPCIMAWPTCCVDPGRQNGERTTDEQQWGEAVCTGG
jgi:hypothetical protein